MREILGVSGFVAADECGSLIGRKKYYWLIVVVDHVTSPTPSNFDA